MLLHGPTRICIKVEDSPLPPPPVNMCLPINGPSCCCPPPAVGSRLSCMVQGFGILPSLILCAFWGGVGVFCVAAFVLSSHSGVLIESVFLNNHNPSAVCPLWGGGWSWGWLAQRLGSIAEVCRRRNGLPQFPNIFRRQALCVRKRLLRICVQILLFIIVIVVVLLVIIVFLLLVFLIHFLLFIVLIMRGVIVHLHVATADWHLLALWEGSALSSLGQRPTHCLRGLLAEVQGVAEAHASRVLQEEEGAAGVSAEVEGAVQVDGRVLRVALQGGVGAALGARRDGRQLSTLLLFVLALVRVHLRHAHHRVLAARVGAVEVGALELVLAVWDLAVHAGAELAEAGRADDVLLAVVLAVGRHLGAVGAAEAAAQAVEVRAVARELAVGEVAAERGLEALEIVQHQVVHTVVVLRVLVHVGAPTELVAAVLPGAVVVGDLQGELAAGILAVLIEVVPPEALQHHPFVQHLARGCSFASFAKGGHVLNDPEALFGPCSRWHGDGVPWGKGKG